MRVLPQPEASIYGFSLSFLFGRRAFALFGTPLPTPTYGTGFISHHCRWKEEESTVSVAEDGI